VFSKNTGHEINFVIHIIFDIRLDMIVWFQSSCYIYSHIFIFVCLVDTVITQS
jgi:hypothetical protein